MMTDTRDERAEPGSDAAATSPVRYPTAIAVGGGLAAAVGSSFIPMNAIEGFVSAYGIAELLPAAAPPLGNTARLALSTGIGTLTAGALLALLPRGETDTMGFETAVKQDAARSDAEQDATPVATGFGASKLAVWLRNLRFGKSEASDGEITDFADLSRLRMRTSDMHPDAPVRAPIMASSDLTTPLEATDAQMPSEAAMPPASAPAPTNAPSAGAMAFEGEPFDLEASMAFAPPEPAMPTPEPSLRFAPPVGVEADAEPAFDADVEDTEAGGYDADIREAPEAVVEAQPQVAQTADLAELGIAALLDRLEIGLARRRQQAGANVSGSASDAATSGRVIPLNNAAAQGFDAAEVAPPLDTGRPPLRFRIGEPRLKAEPPEDTAARAEEPATTASWNETARDDVSPASPEGTDQPAIAADASVQAAATPVPSPADDDMDAALRDALTTLRQLSDRQRNV